MPSPPSFFILKPRNSSSVWSLHHYYIWFCLSLGEVHYTISQDSSTSWGWRSPSYHAALFDCEKVWGLLVLSKHVLCVANIEVCLQEIELHPPINPGFAEDRNLQIFIKRWKTEGYSDWPYKTLGQEVFPSTTHWIWLNFSILQPESLTTGS